MSRRMNGAGNISMAEFSEFIWISNTSKVSNDCLPNSYKDYYYTLSADIYFYGLLVIIPFGLIGNIFSMCVFFLSAILRCTTTGQYLIALAFADSTVLVGDAIRWLATRRHSVPEYYLPQSLGLNFLDYSTAACTITNVVRYGGNLWSVWLTIAISVERLIAVALPLKIGRLSTPRTTRVMIACVGLVSFLLGSFPFWTLHSTMSKTCGVDMPQCKIYNDDAYQWMNTAVVKICTLLIPGILIVALTVAIVALLNRARYKRKAQLNVSQRKQRDGSSARLEVSVETQLTLMLVAVCVSTIALRAPYTIAYYFRSQVWSMPDVDVVTDVQTYVAYRVADIVNTINYAINFLLYCLCGSSFRREARKIFCRDREKTNRCSSLVTEEICLSDMPRKSAGNTSRAGQDR